MNFMTAHQVVHVQCTCPGDLRTKCVQFQLACSLCRGSHKTQVWVCFLILSFLSANVYGASVRSTADVQICLKDLMKAIENSDVMLYAPSVNDVKENCKNMSLRCYMLELIMVMGEEEILENDIECIHDFNDTLPKVNPVGCPPCEAYSMKNIKIFLERLNDLLEEMNDAAERSIM